MSTLSAKKGPSFLAGATSLLDKFVAQMAANGHVGEERAAKLLYLALTTRLFDRPVSVWVQGPSAAGKSRLVAEVQKFFPNEACITLTSMSPNALVYSKESLEYRYLVIHEASGVPGKAAYFLRSLLTEGSLTYDAVTSTSDGPQVKQIVRRGPTGLIITSVKLTVDEELKTRLLLVPINDSPQQTKRIVMAYLSQTKKDADLTDWIEFQRSLAVGSKTVVLPFGERLAELINPAVLRLRRDIPAVVQLIKAHALINSAHRQCDAQGRIMATVREDYAAVRELVSDLITKAAGATVPAKLRETVVAVQSLAAKCERGVMARDLAEALGLDKSSTSRRIAEATDAGYLSNLEMSVGRPSRIVVAKSLPDRCEILPAASQLSGCTVAGDPARPPAKGSHEYSRDAGLKSVAEAASSTPARSTADVMKHYLRSGGITPSGKIADESLDLLEIPAFLDRRKFKKTCV